MKICFIIISFNPKAGYIEKLRKGFEVYNLNIIENTYSRNLGYAGGANEGIREALKTGAEWVVVVNQDVNITKSAIEQFSNKLGKTPAGIAGPFAGRLDEKRWSTILKKEDDDRFRTSQNDDVKYISGAFMAVHRTVFDKIGLFYEPYFLYYEDADLCIRARKAGFPVIEMRVEGISHEDSTSLGRGSLTHEYYLARNHLYFIERNAPINVKLHEMLRMPKTLWEYYKSGNRGALLGIRDYALRRFGECKFQERR